MLWNILYALWFIFPFDKLPELIYKGISIIYFVIVSVVLLLMLIQTIIYIGKFKHLKLKKRCITGFKRCGLKTDTNEIPELDNIYKDTEKEHGLIYEFKNLQIPMEIFEKHTADLQLILKGQIYNMEYGKNTDLTQISILPNKYISPYYIDVNNEFFKENLLNLLLIGPTRFW